MEQAKINQFPVKIKKVKSFVKIKRKQKIEIKEEMAQRDNKEKRRKTYRKWEGYFTLIAGQ